MEMQEMSEGVVQREVRALAAAVLETTDDRLTEGASLAGLGLDSLGVVELKDAIDERYGIDIPMSVMTNRPTVSIIAKAVSKSGTTAGGVVTVPAMPEAQPLPVTTSGDALFAFPGHAETADPQSRRHLEAARSLVPSAIALIEAGIARNWQAGAQLHIRRHDATLVDVGVGMAEAGRSMRADDLLPWLCNNKAVIALAIAVLWQRDELALDDPVAAVVPEFAVHGKERITYRQLLTHTASLRPDAGYQLPGGSKAALWDVICGAPHPEDALPGLEAYYNAIAGFFVLGMTIERIDGRPLERFVLEEVFRPLAVRDARLGFDEASFTTNRRRIAPLFHMSPVGRAHPFLSDAAQFDVFMPGVAGFGPARDLAAVYNALLPGREKESILTEQTKEALTAKHRVGLYDAHWGGFLSHGLGVVTDGGYFGRYCSPRAFGYQGWSSTAVADPEHDLVIVMITNGAVDGTDRYRAVTDAVYRDLGLDAQPLAAPQVTAVEPERTPYWSATAITEDQWWASRG